MKAIRARLRAVDAGLYRDLIRDTAGAMLAMRVVAGLASWIVFNEVYAFTVARAWTVHATITAYMLANLLFALRYRRGEIGLVWVALDMLVNLVAIAVVVQATGGIASPLILVYLIKIAGYAFIFSFEVGMASMAVTLAMLVSLGGLELGGVLVREPLGAVELELERQLNIGVRLGLVFLLLVGAAPLFGRIRRQRELLKAETERARAAAEREGNAAAIAGTLLIVSDAMSRLTSLDEVLGKVVEVLPKVLDVDFCGVLAWDEMRRQYSGRAVAGLDEKTSAAFLAVRLTPEQAPDLEWVRVLGQCAVLPPSPGTPLGLDAAPSLLLAPLISGGRFFGVLVLARRLAATAFGERDITVADGIATQVAVALERAGLIEDGRRLVQALDSTGEAVLITDADGQIVYVNPALLRTLGYAQEEIIGRDAIEWARGLTPEWVASVTASSSYDAWHGETVVSRRDETQIPVLLDTSLIRDAQGTARGYVAIFKDISETKRLREQMQRTDRLASAGQMAAGIAHDVNNAVTGILGQAARARHENDPTSLHRAFSHVESQANRIAAIVQGLLGFARPHPPERREVGVRELVGETVELQRFELDHARVVAELSVPADIPPLWADPKQVQQVLVNIIANACQAMAAKGGRLSIAARREESGVSITIRDSGPGIPPEQLPRVFDPFFTTKESGTGLGLSVAYQIVRAHEGDIAVESAIGEGTCFTIRLPAANARAGRVLVVDDEQEVGLTLVDMLAAQGFEAELVLTGQAALDRIERDGVFEAIFLDVRLPDISGTEVYSRLAAAHPDQARRVVFVTGGLWRGEIEARRGLPPQPALAKPCTAGEVRLVLRALRAQAAA